MQSSDPRVEFYDPVERAKSKQRAGMRTPPNLRKAPAPRISNVETALAAASTFRVPRSGSDASMASEMKGPPPIEVVTEVLRHIKPVGGALLVGGQALGFWAEHYSEIAPELNAYRPYLSKDIDFLGVASAAIRVNGGRIPGQRGGVKAGQCWCGDDDMERAPIGALSISLASLIRRW